MSSSKLLLKQRNRNTFSHKKTRMRFFFNVWDAKRFPWISKSVVTAVKFSVKNVLIVSQITYVQFAKRT